MAIGSGAEIGIVFGRWGEMTEEEQDLWCSTFRERFGNDLLKGYATVHYPKRNKNASIHECRHCGADLKDEYIQQEWIDKGGYDQHCIKCGDLNHYRREIAIYSHTEDMTVSYMCPDCGGRWDRDAN